MGCKSYAGRIHYETAPSGAVFFLDFAPVRWTAVQAGERTIEGFYKTHQVVSRGLAYAAYADMVWCETGKPDLEFARQFAEGIQAKYPGKMLAYNCSPSFNWKKNLDDATVARLQRELGAMGYKFQFVTLVGSTASTIRCSTLRMATQTSR